MAVIEHQLPDVVMVQGTLTPTDIRVLDIIIHSITDRRIQTSPMSITEDSQCILQNLQTFIRVFHPDKEGGSTRAFQRIAEAHELLSDPEKRQLYDDGADLKQKKGNNSDSDSDNEKEKKSLREEVDLYSASTG